MSPYAIGPWLALVLPAFSGVTGVTEAKAGATKGLGPTEAFVRGPFKAETRIVSILPDGARVKAGDLVCELDTTALRQELAVVEVLREASAAELRAARLTAEAAALARAEAEVGGPPALLDEGAAAEAVRAQESTAEGLRARADALRVRIGQGKLSALRDGLVVHARWHRRPGHPAGHVVLEAGASVVAGQPLFRIAAREEAGARRSVPAVDTGAGRP